jgi:hypothetical protein
MAKGISGAPKILRKPKHTSIGNGLVKTSSMNKGKKASFKKYRGQGR